MPNTVLTANTRLNDIVCWNVGSIDFNFCSEDACLSDIFFVLPSFPSVEVDSLPALTTSKMFDARSETLAIVLARRPFGILDVNRALPRGALGILRGARGGTLRTAGLALTAGLTRDAFDTAVDAAFDGIGRRPTMAPFPAVATLLDAPRTSAADSGDVSATSSSFSSTC